MCTNCMKELVVFYAKYKKGYMMMSRCSGSCGTHFLSNCRLRKGKYECSKCRPAFNL